jgi:hypothetical protein
MTTDNEEQEAEPETPDLSGDEVSEKDEVDRIIESHDDLEEPKDDGDA